MKFKRKALAILVLPFLTVTFNGLAGAPAQALGPICAVPSGSYPTIQSAVSDTTCLTVNVAAGTYNEEVTIGHPLTLNGAEANVDARTRSGSESVIDSLNGNGPIQIEADNVTVNGFTIEGATNNPSTDPAAYGAGIWTNPSYSPLGGAQILDNIIQNNIAGIELDNSGVDAARVQYNLIQNNNLPGAGSGNGIEVSFGLSNALIDSNTFAGDTNTSMVDDSFSGTDSSITVSNNTLMGGASEGVAFLDVSNSSIRDNTSIGSTAGATVDLFGEDSNIAITGNVLANGVRGILVENPYAVLYGVGPNSGVTAHTNCIAGNSTAGLEEDTGGYSPTSPGSLDATQNWWGSSTGPTIASNPGGTGDKIIDQDGVVNYTPWLTSQPPSPCPISYTKLASGSFVIGDRNAAVGSSVTFWGAQWSKSNSLSGGSASSSFKGFADNTTTNPPSCGATWSTAPGNSSKPPASVPQYMAVIVTSSVGKSGSSISGNTIHVVVVKTNAGYASDPGHAGTGTVVAQLC